MSENKKIHVVCVTFQGVLDSVEVFFTHTEAESRRFELQIKHENDDDTDVSMWINKDSLIDDLTKSFNVGELFEIYREAYKKSYGHYPTVIS